MIAARKRPDVALKVRKKFYGNGVRGLRDEVPLRHFQFIALQRPRFRQQAIASAGSQHQKIGGAPLAVNAIARLTPGCVHTDHMRALHFAAGFGGAVEQHAIQDRARIDHDRMAHIEHHALLVAADQLDRAHQLFGVRIIEEERKALDRFVGQPAAAGLFPSQMLVKNSNGVACSRQLLATHRSRWPATDNCNLCHAFGNSRARIAPCARICRRKALSVLRACSGDGEDHQAETSEEYSTEDGCGHWRSGLSVYKIHPETLADEKEREVYREEDQQDGSAVKDEDPK